MFKYPENFILVGIGAIWLALMWRVAAADLLRKRKAFASLKMHGRISNHKHTKEACN